MYTKEEDRNLRISKIHHKRKRNIKNIFGKILSATLVILMISSMMALGNEMFEGVIIQEAQNPEKEYANQQLVLLDVTHEHNTVTKVSSFFNIPSGMSDNLVSSINYVQDVLYQRFHTINSYNHNDGSYSWVIPLTQTAGGDYKIRIVDVSNSAYADANNDNFIVG